MQKSIDSLVVLGVDTACVAKSAVELGYKTYVVDHFGDIDVRRFCSRYKATVEQKKGVSCGRIAERFRPDILLRNMRSLVRENKIDAVLLSSGLDDSFNILQQIDELVPILGNSPEVVRGVRDRLKFFKGLRSLSVSFPRTAIVSNPDKLEDAAEKIGYPVVIKPLKGFGGLGVEPAWDQEALEPVSSKAAAAGEKVLVQELIHGVHASISIIVANGHVKVLTVNEQLLGLGSVFQLEPFGYCGNVVPASSSDPIFERCKLLADKIAKCFNLVGSNGIDLVISNEGMPYVIEVNPRFQGSLECVERVLGMNLVHSHIAACLDGTLPDVQPARTRYCTRLILYAPERIVVPDLTRLEWVRDIPFPGSIVEKGEPICSVLADGEDRENSFKEAQRKVDLIFRGLPSAESR